VSEFTFRFQCKRSGNCCSQPEGRVRVTEDEISAIAALVGLGIDGFRSRFLLPGPGGDSLFKMGLGPACIFLEKDKGLATCSIYEARPGHCRSFPFWDELRDDGPALHKAMRFCPGMEPLDKD
jgi:uncharacterized protein